MTLEQDIEKLWKNLDGLVADIEHWSKGSLEADLRGDYSEYDQADPAQVAVVFEQTKDLVQTRLAEGLTSSNQYVRLLAEHLTKEKKAYIQTTTASLFERINDLLVQGDDSSVEKRLLHVAEELGEVSRAQRNIRNNIGTQEELLEETVDLFITAISAVITAGGTADNISEIFWRKCQKWEHNIAKRQN